MRIKLEIPLTDADFRLAGCIVRHVPGDGFHAIVTDSRECSEGDLFAAIVGEHFDGEIFAGEAKSKGAFVLGRKSESADILCNDVRAALLSLAAIRKKSLKFLKKTIAITGSNGKTTVKEFARVILSKRFRTHATDGNLNGDIGLAATVLSSPVDTEILIIEMGMRHPGEIHELTMAVHPDIAIITSIGSAHIGHFASLEGIAAAKSEIADGMNGGRILIPGGEKLLAGLPKDCTLTCSVSDPEADFFLMPLEISATGSVFDFYSEYASFNSAFLSAPGETVLICLCYAVAAALLSGMVVPDILSAISLISIDNTRQKFVRISDFALLDDSYNSSPESLEASLKLLSLYRATPRGALLGDMLELGARTEEFHRAAGRSAVRYGVSHLYLYGAYAPFIAAGARDAGMSDEAILLSGYPSPSECAKKISEKHYPGEIILVKGSHASGLADILYELKKMHGGKET